ncbi:hypothetical protein QQF64_001809 [Cirrhinus molitorella]|uniref:Uncharacterized protein n=1 Tax=Cirrhinus molitorella TaxID=172907 RepID=A0ABR3MND1_9TELE
MASPRLLLGEAGLFNNQHNVFSVLCVGTQTGESPPFHVHTAHSPPFLAHSLTLSPPANAQRTRSLSDRAGAPTGFCHRSERFDFGEMT